MIALGAADANVAHILRNHFAFVERYARPRAAEGDDRWLRAVAAGRIFGLAGAERTPHGVGRSAPLDTRIRPDGTGYRITGRKYYSTGTLFADYVLLRAQDDDGRYASIVVPADREGIQRIDDWDGIGQRLTGSGTTILDDVRAEGDEVIFDTGEPGTPFPFAATLGHLILTGIIAGILQNLVSDAVSLLHGRIRSFAHAPAERPAEDPILQAHVGEIAAAAFAAEATVLAAADALGLSLDAVAAGRTDPALAHAAAVAAAKAKVVIDDLALRAGSRIFDVGGASAAHRDAGLDRHWRNIRTLASHNPTAYKALAIGALEIGGQPFPDTGFF